MHENIWFFKLHGKLQAKQNIDILQDSEKEHSWASLNQNLTALNVNH